MCSGGPASVGPRAGFWGAVTCRCSTYRSHGWAGPTLGVGPRGLLLPLSGPPPLGLSPGPSLSFHLFSAKQSWCSQSPAASRPCPSAGTWAVCPPALPAMVARAMLRALQPLRLCTCSPSGFIKSFLIGCVSHQASPARPSPGLYSFPPCVVAVMGRDTVEVENGGMEGGTPNSVGPWSTLSWAGHRTACRCGESREEAKGREAEGRVGRAGVWVHTVETVLESLQRPMVRSIKQAGSVSSSEQQCNPG